jgi:hypothetical protein
VNWRDDFYKDTKAYREEIDRLKANLWYALDWFDLRVDMFAETPKWVDDARAVLSRDPPNGEEFEKSSNC